ncbi:ATP citrate-lyase [Suillus occidentalis]|nr:ATP citrate-lyase [Suillus occidentalis]
MTLKRRNLGAAIREYDAKLLLAYWLQHAPAPNPKLAPSPSSAVKFPAPRVAQILGKAGLLALHQGWQDAKKGIQDIILPQVESVTGTLSSFIVEPFLPHPSDSEYYICITSACHADTLLFTTSGSADKTLLREVPAHKKEILTDFLVRLYSVYVDLHFAYLEINPLVVLDDGSIHCFDMVAKLDQTAKSIYRCTFNYKINADRGPPMAWPAPFGRDLTKEEACIQKLDASTGASLKLTVLNPTGRVWTMVADGGASVVYSDAIAAAGFAHELANYGEYSGAPSEDNSRPAHALTRPPPRPDGKILIIGGGIANFTDVAATFKGVIRALTSYKTQLIAHKAEINVRHGDPNWREGLKSTRLLSESLSVPIRVSGPDTHITEIVPLALSLKSNTSVTAHIEPATLEPGTTEVGTIHADGERTQPDDVVGMLGFDYSCKRARPSVAAMVYPFGGHHIQKFYCGTRETLLPVYTSLEDAVKKHSYVDVVVNFASSRSVYSSTMEMFADKGVLIIGPATVGGIKPGCFRIGKSGGHDGQHHCLQALPPWRVGYVSKSGGMSNESNNILSLVTNGTYKGIAIGGDRYPGSTFIDHLLRYEADRM